MSGILTKRQFILITVLLVVGLIGSVTGIIIDSLFFDHTLIPVLSFSAILFLALLIVWFFVDKGESLNGK